MSTPLKRPSRRDRFDHWFRRTFRTELRQWHKHLLAVTAGIILLVVGLTLYADRTVAPAVQRAIAHGGFNPGGPKPPPIEIRFSGVSLPAHFSLGRYLTYHHWQSWLNRCVGETAAAATEVTNNIRYAATHHGSLKGAPHMSAGYVWRQSNGNTNQGITYAQAAGTLINQGELRHSRAVFAGQSLDSLDSYWSFAPSQSLLQQASSHRFQTMRSIFSSDRPTMKTLLTRGIPVWAGIPVDLSFKQFVGCGAMAYQSGPFQFYHSILIYAYDKKGVWADNWWNQPGGPAWGCGGHVHLTWGFLTRYSAYLAAAIPRNPVAPRFGGGPLGVAQATAGAFKGWKQHQLSPVAPPPVKPLPLTFGGGVTYGWVYKIAAQDLPNVDLAPTINAAAHHYGLSSVGVAMVLGGECRYFTHSPTCDRCPTISDCSFGACQVTVPTAAQYGLGDGTYNSVQLVKTYENQYANCIWLGARVLASMKAYEWRVGCYIDFPQLAVAWNAGPGNPCGYFYAPSGLAGSNYQNYLGWWAYAQAHALSYDPYAVKPKPFPLAAWCRSSVAHRTRCPSPYYGGHLALVPHAWVPQQHRCGSVTGREQWHPQRHFMSTPFEGCVATSWPTKRGWPVRFHVFGHHAFGGAAATECAAIGKGCIQATVDRFNAERALYGVAPLTVSWSTSHCAVAHSRAMAAAGSIFHVSGLTDVTACWPTLTAAQNVGMGYGTKDQASTMIYNLMAQEPVGAVLTNHHTNWLNGAYARVAMGYARDVTGKLYITQDFAP